MNKRATIDEGHVNKRATIDEGPVNKRATIDEGRLGRVHPTAEAFSAAKLPNIDLIPLAFTPFFRLVTWFSIDMFGDVSYI